MNGRRGFRQRCSWMPWVVAACWLPVAGLASGPGARVGVIVTGWGTVEGNSPEYNTALYERAFLGERATTADEPCTGDFFGEYPYRAELGQVPFAVVFKVPGLESIWDGSGVYRLSADGGSYISLVDPRLTLTRDQAGTAKVIPAREMPFGGRAFVFTPDPRDGTDHLAGYYKVFRPNGLQDALEMATLGAMRRDAMMGYLDQPPRPYPFQLDLERYLRDSVRRQFGDRADVRFGYYAAIPGMTRQLEDVAAEFAREGYRNLLVARETTDQNFYANVVWDRNHTLKGLCRAGFHEGDGEGGIRLEQVRQVGRTPEYNHMLVENLRPYFKVIPAGVEVSLIYATHGYPFPGAKPIAGAMSKGDYEITETFHENAYLNYLSFRAYALAAFDRSGAGRHRLNFWKSGGSGGPDARTNNLFAYAHVYEPMIGSKNDPSRFQTVRNALEAAIRVDGRREIIIVLSHWYKNSNNTAVEIRDLNQLPINSIAELRRGIYAMTWCERYTAEGVFDQYRPDAGQGCRDGYARVQLTEAFDRVAQEFFIGYASRVRGGIERFGVLPDLGLSILARGPVTRSAGGVVAVDAGPLAGARLAVRPDPNPGLPESYTWEKAFRPATDGSPNTAPDALRAINEYAGIADYLDSAKDDFTALIGVQERADGARQLPKHPRAVSKAVYFGPYRTLFNAPAEITLPYEAGRAAAARRISPYVYNEITRAYDPVYPVAGGRPPRIDPERGLVTFDVQVLGNFVLVAEAGSSGP